MVFALDGRAAAGAPNENGICLRRCFGIGQSGKVLSKEPVSARDMAIAKRLESTMSDKMMRNVRDEQNRENR